METGKGTFFTGNLIGNVNINEGVESSFVQILPDREEYHLTASQIGKLEGWEVTFNSLIKNRCIVIQNPFEEFLNQVFYSIGVEIRKDTSQLALGSIEYPDAFDEQHRNQGLISQIFKRNQEEIFTLGRPLLIRVVVANETAFEYQKSFLSRKFDSIRSILAEGNAYLIFTVSDEKLVNDQERLKYEFHNPITNWQLCFLEVFFEELILKGEDWVIFRNQINGGLWGNDNFRQQMEVVQQARLGHLHLLEEINARKQEPGAKVSPWTRDLEQILNRIEDPEAVIDRSILFIACFMDGLRYREFSTVAGYLLEDEIIEEAGQPAKIDPYHPNAPSPFKQEPPKKIPAIELWKADPDKFMRRCLLAPREHENGVQTVDFKSVQMRDQIKSSLQDKIPLYLQNRFLKLVRAKVFQMIYISSGIPEALARLTVQLGLNDPQAFGKNLLDVLVETSIKYLNIAKIIRGMIEGQDYVKQLNIYQGWLATGARSEAEQEKKFQEMFADFQPGDHQAYLNLSRLSKELLQISDSLDLRTLNNNYDTEINILSERINLLLNELEKSRTTSGISKNFYETYTLQESGLILKLLNKQIFSLKSRHLPVLRKIFEEGERVSLHTIFGELIKHVNKSNEEIYKVLELIRSWSETAYFNHYFLYYYSSISFTLLDNAKGKGLSTYDYSKYPLFAPLKHSDTPGVHLEFLLDWLVVSDDGYYQNDLEEDPVTRETSDFPHWSWFQHSKFAGDDIKSKADLIQKWYLLLHDEAKLRECFLQTLKKVFDKRSKKDLKHSLTPQRVKKIKQWKKTRNELRSVIHEGRFPGQGSPVLDRNQIRKLKERRKLCAELIETLRT